MFSKTFENTSRPDTQSLVKISAEACELYSTGTNSLVHYENSNINSKIQYSTVGSFTRRYLSVRNVHMDVCVDAVKLGRVGSLLEEGKVSIALELR